MHSMGPSGGMNSIPCNETSQHVFLVWETHDESISLGYNLTTEDAPSAM